MAHSLQSDFKIYQEYFDAGFVEVLQQNGAAFNGASQGAIQLRSEILKGNFAYDSFFDVVSGLVARRDTTSTSTASDTPLTMDEFISVKLDRKVGPIGVSLDAMKKKARDPREVSFILGQQTATAVQLEQLNTALLACEAALDNIAALEHNASGSITTEDLIDTLKKAGDSAGGIVAWVMHSASYFELLKDQVQDAVYRADGVSIMQGSPATLGRIVVVTDSDALAAVDEPSSGATTYSVLGLRRGAIDVVISETPTMVTELVTGYENMFYRVQGEHSYNLGLKGMRYNVASGENPNAAAVGTGSNWVKSVTSDKLLPGVILKHV